MGGALVKTSASGPIATSRYCDQTPSTIRASFSFCAWAEPGTTLRMSVPMRAASCSRISCALPGTPLARSSITRSMADTAKVTPAALTPCRSTGARSFPFALPPFPALSSPRSLMSPRSLPEGTPFHFSISSATVGAVLETSKTRPSFTTTGVGPSPKSMRPTSTASRQSSGRGNRLLVMTLSLRLALQFDLQDIANVIRGDAGAFLRRPPRRGIQLDIEMAAPVDGFQIGHDGRKVYATFAHGIKVRIVHHVPLRRGHIPGAALIAPCGFLEVILDHAMAQFLAQRHRIHARHGDMACIQHQADIFRLGILHDVHGFLLILDLASQMGMDAELHAQLLTDALAQEVTGDSDLLQVRQRRAARLLARPGIGLLVIAAEAAREARHVEVIVHHRLALGRIVEGDAAASGTAGDGGELRPDFVHAVLQGFPAIGIINLALDLRAL